MKEKHVVIVLMGPSCTPQIFCTLLVSNFWLEVSLLRWSFDHSADVLVKDTLMLKLTQVMSEIQRIF